MLSTIWRNWRPNRAGAAQAHARPSVKQDVTLSVLDRQPPHDRDNSVANLQALLASHLGPTADLVFEKANAKAIRDLNRNIAALQPIPPAEDTDGNGILIKNEFVKRQPPGLPPGPPNSFLIRILNSAIISKSPDFKKYTFKFNFFNFRQ